MNLVPASLLVAFTLAAATGVAFGENADSVYREVEHTGLDFIHFNGAAGDYLLPEITCGAGALLDYDNDGDLDVYLVQGAPLGTEVTNAGIDSGRESSRPMDRLYRNDLSTPSTKTSGPRFVDVTARSGVELTNYGCGAAAGDFDNDGWIDLYVTGLGKNRLLRNNGNGTFSSLAGAETVEDERWSVPAVWLDFDRDGWLDLFVGNYLKLAGEEERVCRTSAGVRDYCNPSAYQGVEDALFRNRGDGTFTDVTRNSGIAGLKSKSLGTSVADFNSDGRLDLYVANDGIPNQLWMQLADGTFAEEALLAGCAVNAKGLSEASMGVDAADFDGDGDEDLFMTHLSGETNTLFLNDGYGNFDDRTVALGLGVPSWPFTSWGTRWLDFDNDGRLDLVAVNGAVRAIEELSNSGDPYPFHQPNQLFRNVGEGKFAEMERTQVLPFARSEVSRGLLAGDLDNDGDEDLVVINVNAPARVLVNETGHKNAWLGLEARIKGINRHDLGTRVELVRSGSRSAWRRLKTDGGYGASHDPRVLFGLDSASDRQTVRLHGLEGERVELQGLPLLRYTTVYRTPYWE
jgi:hypothetical protein